MEIPIAHPKHGVHNREKGVDPFVLIQIASVDESCILIEVALKLVILVRLFLAESSQTIFKEVHACILS